MVDRVLCHLYPGRVGIGPCDLWVPIGSGRAGHSRVVLVFRLLHGHVYR